MKDWIMELCPEIAEWQADMIAEECDRAVLRERERCAKAAAEHCWETGCMAEMTIRSGQ